MSVKSTDDLTKPIRTSPDGRFLVRPDGEPFFWLGDTAWELFRRLDRDDADLYLKDRAAKDFNVVQANAIGLIDGLDSPNPYGELPLIDRDPTRPNPRYFEHVDWIVDRAAHYGMRIGMLPVWGADLVGGYGPDQHKIFNASNAQPYAEWLAARYREKGIIWILGGDTLGLWPKDIEGEEYPILIDYRPVYDAFARGITAASKPEPFITFHPCPMGYFGTPLPRTSIYFGNRSWLRMNMLQSSHFADAHKALASLQEQNGNLNYICDSRMNYSAVQDEYRSIPVRPVIDAEPHYENHPIMDAENDERWSSYQARNAAYHALFAGAAGHTYGEFSIWDFYDPANKAPGRWSFAKWKRGKWQDALNAPGAGQMQHARSLLLSRPYFTRIPDQSLVIGDAGEGEAHIGATRDREGSYAMIYIPQGQRVTIDLTKISGQRAVGWWYDPRLGTSTQIDETMEASGTLVFVPPSSGPENDWVLVLDQDGQNFSVPGASK